MMLTQANKAARPVLAMQARALSASAPSAKPENPMFSSGPCAKRPGWNVSALQTDSLGRSHRSKIGKERLGKVIEESKRILGVPSDYHLGIVPGSDTGAFEMAMWSMLGPKPLDAFAFESFGSGWLKDALNELKLGDQTAVHEADYGVLPDMSKARKDADVMFTYNGTTSGVRVPNLDFIADDREGLSMVDATSAVFSMKIDWSKVDVLTYSWQKVLGGEGAHGVLVLSPRAVERLESHTPSWPMPKVFRLTKKGKLNGDIFKGSTINTPSMLCVEDCLDALKWADSVGGLDGMIDRSEKNLQIVREWVEATPYASFLAQEPSTVSCTSICLSLDGISKDNIKKMTSFLEKEDVAYDIGSYRDAPPGLRIWGGATVENEDMKKLMPWISHAYEKFKDQ
ncbi:Phosphoserine aminotransferase [Hondaea fermentalgiana]|uniref:phosphoserine transaminase n=1 Tax=Hondaea fermentalgiana TaxID=2315210 RepID=A0A2R5GUM6_9STRA|nr:Phosphoserine aminotransferase [Hondaea fermentalgiana]|eukprot:GBG31594.1 Phosphoserine aminotransferase [Hondaea fermentalgiana]